MIQVGLKAEAFQLLTDCLDTLDNKLGYIYQLPGSLYSNGVYKEDLGTSLLSSGGIWAFQFCYEQDREGDQRLISEDYHWNLEHYMTLKIADSMSQKELKRQLKQKENEDEDIFTTVSRSLRRSLSFIME